MNDFDLESKLRALGVPERGEDYWEAFPGRVMMEARRASAQRPAPQPFRTGLPSLGRLALACLMLGFCLWQSRMPGALSHALRKDEQQVRQSVERFHNNLGRFLRDEHGLHQLIEDPS